MSHAACQSADRIYSLQLPQRLSRATSLCDVMCLPPKLAVVPFAQYRKRALCKKAATVLANLPTLVVGPAAAICRLQQIVGHSCLNVLQRIEAREVLSHHVALRVTEYAFRPAIPTCHHSGSADSEEGMTFYAIQQQMELQVGSRQLSVEIGRITFSQKGLAPRDPQFTLRQRSRRLQRGSPPKPMSQAAKSQHESLQLRGNSWPGTGG